MKACRTAVVEGVTHSRASSPETTDKHEPTLQNYNLTNIRGNNVGSHRPVLLLDDRLARVNVAAVFRHEARACGGLAPLHLLSLFFTK